MNHHFSTFYKNLSTRVVAVHIVCWSLFIAYELGLLYYTMGKIEPALAYFIYYPQNIVFFYAVILILNFTFRNSRPRLLKGVLLYVVITLVNLMIKFFIQFFIETHRSGFRQYSLYYWKNIVLNLARGISFTILATFYWASGHIAYFKKQAADKENRQLMAEKDKALLEVRLRESQNAYLKQQLNPHLLFNVLNFIYSRVFKNSKKAAESVLLLSEIMAFSIRETGTDGKVPLTEEILQIKNLITLNHNRFDSPLYFDIRYEGDFDGYRIIPLVLLTLTENLFKHGDLTNPAGALLHIEVTPEGRLTYHSKNHKRPGNPQQKTGSIGLKNVQVRLDYSYAGNYLLNVSENNDVFDLSLNLKL